ncbi:MAG: hypothetical protein M3O50_18300, partial [Myxococcota bacterium]|nr:hypothetical protein [Myxococcota bacterium]
MTTRKRSPEDILDELEDERLADEAERVLALSGPELDRELARQGVDSSALRAGATAVFERAMRARAESLANASGEAPRGGESSSPAVAPGPGARPTSSAVL